jgi:hypothetical protein
MRKDTFDSLPHPPQKWQAGGHHGRRQTYIRILGAPGIFSPSGPETAGPGFAGLRYRSGPGPFRAGSGQPHGAAHPFNPLREDPPG